MSEDVREHAQKLAQDLENAGHTEHAAQVHHVLASEHLENGFLWALRNTLDTILTFVEAIDPVSEMTIEGLRTKIDANLQPSDKAEE
jgi:hypothetical protein